MLQILIKFDAYFFKIKIQIEVLIFLSCTHELSWASPAVFCRREKLLSCSKQVLSLNDVTEQQRTHSFCPCIKGLQLRVKGYSSTIIDASVLVVTDGEPCHFGFFIYEMSVLVCG